MFRHRQLLRRWAARTLFLWLFGVAASVANACLIPAPNAAAGHAAQSEDRATSPHHADLADTSPGSTSGLQVPVGNESPAAANCVDFCDKAGISIPPLKSTLDDGQVQASAPPALQSPLPVAAIMPSRRQPPRWIDVAAPPIPIAFLRLAL
jgi:hypothetical protein